MVFHPISLRFIWRFNFIWNAAPNLWSYRFKLKKKGKKTKQTQHCILHPLLLFLGISSYHCVNGWKTSGSQKRPSWLKEQRKWWKQWSHYHRFCRQHFWEGFRHAHTAASSSKYSGVLVKFHPWLMNEVDWSGSTVDWNWKQFSHTLE